MNHLLIVDDNPLDRELARRLVEEHSGIRAEFAGNGLEALEHIEAAVPLAVLTDLQMPEMDGLGLVCTLRRRYPTIPVVLMTAHGSEELALEAMVQGAVDYVPKQRLACDLPRVLKGVLAADFASRRHGEITHRLQYKQLRYRIERDVHLIPPLVDHLQQAAANMGLVNSADRVRLARSLAEALHNAVVHGAPRRLPAIPHLEQSPCIDVLAEFTRSDARFVIQDHGPGFNYRAVADPRTEPGHLTGDCGRGLALIRLFMDEVSFNDAGNEITMLKRRAAPIQPR
jgi:CheY-like chemotaxis protein